MTQPSINKLAIRHELWRRGLINFKFHAVQKELFEIYDKAPEGSTLVWLLARQSGKSFCLGLLAIMQCLRKPNSIVKLLTDTKLHARTIYEPLFREILEDCPEDMQPEYISSSYVYIFKNGSQIQLAGSDGGHCERLRGQKSDLILVDEAGFCDNLDYNVNSILFPTTTHTGGKIVLASTPSPEPDHDFSKFIEQAEANKLLTKKTVWDNPLLTKEYIETVIVSRFKGGVTNPQFRREYLCEQIKDENLSVLPEVDDDLLEKIVKIWETPPFYNRYVAMDIGFRDLTVVLYGYYDFKNDKVIIQDEIVKNGKQIHLPDFAKLMQEKEVELWTNHLVHEIMKPSARVSDVNPFVIQEINIASKKNNPLHPIDFAIASKNDKLAHINKLRVMLSNEKIIINPKCDTLIRHLKHCRWKDRSNKEEFARSTDDGHYDAVDALLYFCRAVDYNKNPYPAGYGYNSRDLHIQNPSDHFKESPNEIYSRIFGQTRKKKTSI